MASSTTHDSVYKIYDYHRSVYRYVVCKVTSDSVELSPYENVDPIPYSNYDEWERLAVDKAPPSTGNNNNVTWKRFRRPKATQHLIETELGFSQSSMRSFFTVVTKTCDPVAVIDVRFVNPLAGKRMYVFETAWKLTGMFDAYSRFAKRCSLPFGVEYAYREFRFPLNDGGDEDMRNTVRTMRKDGRAFAEEIERILPPRSFFTLFNECCRNDPSFERLFSILPSFIHSLKDATARIDALRTRLRSVMPSETIKRWETQLNFVDCSEIFDFYDEFFEFSPRRNLLRLKTERETIEAFETTLDLFNELPLRTYNGTRVYVERNDDNNNEDDDEIVLNSYRSKGTTTTTSSKLYELNENLWKNRTTNDEFVIKITELRKIMKKMSDSSSSSYETILGEIDFVCTCATTTIIDGASDFVRAYCGCIVRETPSSSVSSFDFVGFANVDSVHDWSALMRHRAMIDLALYVCDGPACLLVENYMKCTSSKKSKEYATTDAERMKETNDVMIFL